MKPETKSIFRLGVGVFVLYLVIHYWPDIAGLCGALVGAAFPLLIGCVIAYVINIPMGFFERHWFPGSEKPVAVKTRRGMSLLLSLVSVVAVAALVLRLILPQLASCVQVIFAELPGAMEQLVNWLGELEVLPENLEESLESIDWQSRFSQILSVLTSGIGNVVGTVVTVASSVFSGLVTAFLAIIFAFYILFGKERLGRQFSAIMDRYLRPSWVDKCQYVLGVLNDCFLRYIVGQCTEAVILGSLCALGMWILRMPYAAMIGALIAFTALIPVAGAYIGGGIGAFMIFTVSPMQAVVFVIYLVILQQIEGNLIYPRVVGSSLGLPGIWVLAAVTVGGGLLGIAGMLLGVPITAAIYRLLRDDVYRDRLPVEDTPPAE